MSDDTRQPDPATSASDDLIEIDLNFESMRRFQAEFSQNLATDGLFIDTAEPLDPGAVVRFRVVLPEDFVFLEGTAVVEWVRRPEDAGGRPAGMALRFVTMSPQNQELVEQLVQDHIDAGGERLDLDVRPVPSDFPTDALEGAPTTATEAGDDAYRLTIRGAGPSLDEQALQALAEAVPDEAAPVPTASTDDEAGSGSGRAGGIGEPPELDLGPDDAVVLDATGEADEEHALDAGEVESGDHGEVAPAAETHAAIGGITLPEPEDFDDGPEVIDDIDDGFSGAAFDVSLPDADDEPDSTPVLPDEGGADVTVADDDEEAPPSGASPWWLAAALVAVVAVVAAVAFWPRIADRSARATGGDGAPLVADAGEVEVSRPTVVPQPAPAESTDLAAVEDGGAGWVAEGAGPASPNAGEHAAPKEEPVAAAAEPAGEPVAESTGSAAELPAARSITDVTVRAGSGRTVLRLVGDGSLEDGVISVETLPTPPRVLVRVRGIESGYRPYTIDSTTPEVSRVRIGHHADRRVPELWVVLDLTGTDVALAGVDIEGDSARIAVARP
ncbi:MAG: TIGR02266 family protein [Holophagae bacterium]|jgi:uncharacterized protein (TIGR02266 family)